MANFSLDPQGQSPEQQEKFFRLLLDHTYDWESWESPDGRLLYVSKAVERITGYSPEAFLEDENLLASLVAPEDRASWENHRQTHLQDNHQPLHMDFRLQDRKGKLHWIAHICQPLFSDSGQFLGRRSSNRDITDRRTTEQALQERDHTFQVFMDAVEESVFALSPEGVVLEANATTLERLGLGAPEFIGRSVYDCFPADLAVERRRQIKTMLAEKRPVHFEDFRNGLWLDNSLYPVFNEAGEVDRIVGISRDITQHKATEDSLHYLNVHLEEEVERRIRESHQVIAALRESQKEQRRVNRSLRVLKACNQFLVRAEDEGMFLGEICTMLIQLGGYRMAWVGIGENDEARRVRPVARAGKGSDFLEETPVFWSESPEGGVPPGKAIRTGQPFFSGNIQQEEGYGLWREGAVQRGFFSTAALPLYRRGQVIGVLNLFASQTDAFSEEEMQLLKELARDVAFGMDVLRTRQQNAEAQEALRVSETRYRALFEQAVDALAMVDMETGRLTAFNDLAHRNLGYTREEFEKLDLSDINAEMSPEEIKTRIAEIDAKGELAFETLQRRRDGSIRNVLVKTRRIDIDGHPYMQSIWRDITEQKRDEQKLRDSEEWFRALFNNAVDAIFLMSLDEEDKPGNFIEVNQTAIDRLGYSLEEFRQMNPRHLLADPEMGGIEKVLHECLQRGSALYETRHKGKDGWVWPVEVSARILRLQEQRMLLGVARDISERKQAEDEARLRQRQLLQADKMISLGILVSGVAHEINNPNHFIMTHATQLRHAWNSILPLLESYYRDNGEFQVARRPWSIQKNQIPQMFDSLIEGSERIRAIVDELRDYARENPEGRTEPVQVNDVVHSALALLSNLIQKCTHRFSLSLDEDLPLIRGNYQRLEQVLINLIQNACQALPDPNRGICVTTQSLQDGKWLLCEVQDEGIGIPQENLDRLSDPFFTTKPEGSGMGLGLSISSGIVLEHGGRLEFESEPGQGTRARVLLPLEKNEKGPL